MKRALRLRPAAAALLLLAAPARGETIPAPVTLTWALERAFAASPALAVAEAQRDAARERVGPAGALDDPRFAYEASNVPTGDLDFASTPLSGHQLGLRQRVPFPGTLRSRRRAAAAGFDAAESELAHRRLAVAAAVESAWAELGFAQRALAVTDRNLALLRQLSSTAEAKYRVGDGLQQDVLRAHVEVTALLAERLEREAAVAVAAARLAALLDLAEAGPWPETAPLADAAPIPEPAPLLSSAEARSPKLRALDARVEQAREAVRVAKLEGLPDFDLGFGYRVRKHVTGDAVDGDDFLSAGVTLRLPVNRRKWRAHAAAARADLRRAEAERRRGLAGLRERVRSAHAELVRADADGVLIDTGLLPQAQQSLESSRSGYEVGRVDFPSLLDSQVRLLNAELRRIRARADRRSAFAMLEAAVGEGLR